ncbi:MAG: hypothetical protein ACHQ0J_06775 [Candidatus Dormibacterales bacterium]
MKRYFIPQGALEAAAQIAGQWQPGKVDNLADENQRSDQMIELLKGAVGSASEMVGAKEADRDLYRRQVDALERIAAALEAR